MHEYTYVGTVCDTDANATLMEMRAGGLCVMIEWIRMYHKTRIMGYAICENL